MIEHWTAVKFERLITLRKKLNFVTESREEVRKELARALMKELWSILENVSIEDFMEYFCKFSNYEEEVSDGIIKGDRTYY